MNYGAIPKINISEYQNDLEVARGEMGLLSVYLQSWKDFPRDIKFANKNIRKAHFLKSQWENVYEGDERVSNKYLIYRLVYFLIFGGILAQNLVCVLDNLFFIYLTNWNLIFQIAYSTIYFFYVLTYWFSHTPSTGNIRISSNDLIEYKENISAIGFLEVVIWILLNVLGTTSIAVTLGYWLAVSKYDEDTSSCTFVSTLLVHGINAILAIVDNFIIGIPIRPTHLLYPAVVAVLYGSFSGVYEAVSGIYEVEEEPYIYSILNWRETPGLAAATCVIAFLIGAVFHFIYWLQYRLRILLVRNFGSFEHEGIFKIEENKWTIKKGSDNFGYNM